MTAAQRARGQATKNTSGNAAKNSCPAAERETPNEHRRLGNDDIRRSERDGADKCRPFVWVCVGHQERVRAQRSRNAHAPSRYHIPLPQGVGAGLERVERPHRQIVGTR